MDYEIGVDLNETSVASAAEDDPLPATAVAADSIRPFDRKFPISYSLFWKLNYALSVLVSCLFGLAPFSRRKEARAR